MTGSRGHTLAEALVVLALLGLLLAMAAPPIRGWLDRCAVRAARDEVAGALARVRIAAVGSGGAALMLDPARARIWTRTPARDTLHAVDLGERYGVTLDAGAGVVELPFDALGIGRLTSRTIVLRRGHASAGLVVSAYGRARPW